MKVSGFAATADIVGRRIRVTWEFVPEDPETLADIPPVTLRRKLRDFAFPTPATPDPYLVYDSNAFPPAPVPGELTVTDLPTWEVTQDNERTVFEPVSVAVAPPLGGRMVEIRRCTIGITYDTDGVPVRQRVEILDAGQQPGDLQANTVYYYQLFSHDLPSSGDDTAPYRSSAMVTDSYGLNRTLYESLPEIYRRHDVETRPITPGTDSVPEQAPRFGQLRRFVDLFGIALDSLRGTAEGLRTLHDVDRVDASYLTLLAQWIGWDLSVNVDIPLQRNEIKTASRLYRLVGTLPGLRALVSQYTGWFTQVAEFAQNLVLSNRPPQRNLFAITVGTNGVSWHGVDDAAELLGFGPNNQDDTGEPGKAATLTGTVSERFALRPGMELTLAVDGQQPTTMRFGPDDFADIGHATVAEVAAAIRGALPEVTTSAEGGRLVLTSETVGELSALKVVPAPTSLVSLESAPAGRLSPCTDSQGRIRLFYEAWETPTQPVAGILAPGVLTPSSAGNYVLRRVRYKTFLDGAWRDSHPVFSQRVTPQADPAALALPDDRTWVAWIDDPQTDAARLRFAIGRSRPTLAARLLGQRREPFTLTNGAVLTLTGNWPGVDSYVVRAADFANLARATATEVVAALNSQLTHVAATRERNGAIRLETVGGGAQATVAVDLRRSTTARVLGFDHRNAVGTPGSWSEEIDWSAVLDVVSIAPGRHAEVATVNDPAGGVRLAWATHRAGQWRIHTAHWDERILIGTANGLFVRVGTGPWGTVGGLPSPDVRAVTLDSDGTAWIATANGVGLLRSDGSIAALTPALPSPDVRAVALGSDGTAWIATAGGVEGRAPDGTITRLTTANGLPSLDVRAVTLTDAGTLWVATAAGVMERLQNGVFHVFNADSGLPSSSIRDVAIAADGTVWVATAGGVSTRSKDGVWTTFDTARGLRSNDVRSVSLATDGTVWVGTATGVSVIVDGAVSNLDIVGGGAANPAARSIHTGWSAPRELASGGGSNREPTLIIDEINRTWLIWSQRVGAGNPDENWGLHYRIFDPATRTWGADTVLTTPPGGGHSSDRTPSALRLRQPSGVRVFFASDRNGGFGLWSVDITLTGVVAPLVSFFDEPSSDLAPAPVTVGGAVWLLYRSDRNVPLAQIGASPLGDGLLQTVRVPDNGTLRRYAGSISVVPNDLVRTRTRRSFGDMLSYTPNRPAAEAPLQDDELYTRGTVGLYVSRAHKGNPLTQQEASRLRELLARFIPVNLRAVVIVVPSVDTEFVYTLGADIQESYHDQYPFADVLGTLSDSTTAVLPNVVIIRASLVDNVSANPADLTTLRRRTWFPPLQ